MLRRYRPRQSVKPWQGPKPKLPMRVASLCWVHYLDLQEYLAEVYRMRGYDVLFTLGVANGMFPEFIVTGKMPPAWNIAEQADNIRRGRYTRNLGLILNVLCADGFIDRGKYIIDTSKRLQPK